MITLNTCTLRVTIVKRKSESKLNSKGTRETYCAVEVAGDKYVRVNLSSPGWIRVKGKNGALLESESFEVTLSLNH